jgi:uncharacterized protein YlxW (UPF0749 family)
MANKYQNNSFDSEIQRIQQLMGLKKEITNEHKDTPLGTVIKSLKADDGNTYAIIKENKNFYLKKTNKSVDLQLEDFEYLGGSRLYKNLFEYESLNAADKFLKEEISKINKEVKVAKRLDESKKEYANNLTSSTESKAMREEIERVKKIMGIKLVEGQTLNELSLDDDEAILTDDTDETEEEFVEELPDGDELVDDVDIVDGEDESDVDTDDLSDEELDQKDVDLDQELVDQIPSLQDDIAQLQDAIAELQATIDSENDGDLEVDEVDEIEEPIEGEEDDIEIVDDEEEPFEENIENAEEPLTEDDDFSGDGDVPITEDEDNMGTVEEQEEFKFTLGPTKGKNIASHPGDVVKADEFTMHRAIEEGKQYYIVEKDGTVYGQFKGTRNFDKLPKSAGTGSAKGKGAPFNKKVKGVNEGNKMVDAISSKVLQEFINAGVFIPKKKV